MHFLLGKRKANCCKRLEVVGQTPSHFSLGFDCLARMRKKEFFTKYLAIAFLREKVMAMALFLRTICNKHCHTFVVLLTLRCFFGKIFVLCIFWNFF